MYQYDIDDAYYRSLCCNAKDLSNKISMHKFSHDLTESIFNIGLLIITYGKIRFARSNLPM